MEISSPNPPSMPEISSPITPSAEEISPPLPPKIKKKSHAPSPPKTAPPPVPNTTSEVIEILDKVSAKEGFIITNGNHDSNGNNLEASNVIEHNGVDNAELARKTPKEEKKAPSPPARNLSLNQSNISVSSAASMEEIQAVAERIVQQVVQG